MIKKIVYINLFIEIYFSVITALLNSLSISGKDDRLIIKQLSVKALLV